MTVIGYARVSTTDHNLEVQENALRVGGCEIIRSEKRSGTTTAGREHLHQHVGCADVRCAGQCLTAVSSAKVSLSSTPRFAAQSASSATVPSAHMSIMWFLMTPPSGWR